MLCLGRKNRTAADVIRAVEDRLAGLFDGVGRDADEHLRANDLTDFVDEKFILADVDAVGSAEDGYIGAVVDDQERLT